MHSDQRAIGPREKANRYYIEDNLKRQQPKIQPITWLVVLPDKLVAIGRKVIEAEGEKAIPLDVIVTELEELVGCYNVKINYDHFSQNKNWVFKILMEIGVSNFNIFVTYTDLVKRNTVINNNNYRVQIIASATSLFRSWTTQGNISTNSELHRVIRAGYWQTYYNILSSEISFLLNSGVFATHPSHLERVLRESENDLRIAKEEVNQLRII